MGACNECGQGRGHMKGCPSLDKPSKRGGERSVKAPPPENTIGHSHDYRLSREYTEIMRDGKTQWRYYYKEFTCRAKHGKCDRPVHVDFMRRVRI